LFEFTDRNFGGSGNEVGVNLNSSIIDTSKFTVKYNHRWLMGLPLSLGVDFTTEYSRLQAAMANRKWWFNGDEPDAFPDGFNSYQAYLDHNKLPPSEYLMNYYRWYISLGLSTGYRWATFLGTLNLSGGMRFGVIKNSFEEIFKPFDPVLRDGNNRWTPRNSFWSSLSLDQRDIYYDPSNGYYLSERMGFYGILGNELEHYVRSDSSAEYFLTLFDIPVKTWRFKSVLAMHAGISFLFSQPFRDRGAVIEEANKLAIDGMFTGRGWSDIYRDKGYTLIDSWIELRFPLVRGILAFDLFLDAAGTETEQGYYLGTNSAGDPNFTIDNFKFSFGGGFRVTMPQFPIRLSLAKRFYFENGNFKWKTGALFANKEGSGVDIVLSFVISY
jgi:outer membrane protein insertion porin family